MQVSGALKQQHERYQAAHARLWNGPPKLRIVDEPITIVNARSWQLEEVQQDWHVQMRNRRLSEMAANGPKVYVKDRCRELGVSFAEVVGAGRRHKISLIRHRLIWEVAQHFGLSYPALGRLFGGRDHTSCLYAVRRIEALNGAPQ